MLRFGKPARRQCLKYNTHSSTSFLGDVMTSNITFAHCIYRASTQMPVYQRSGRNISLKSKVDHFTEIDGAVGAHQFYISIYYLTTQASYFLT